MANNTIGGTGGALMGAGLVLIDKDWKLGLGLIGIGSVMTILVAFLQKAGLDVKSTLG